VFLEALGTGFTRNSMTVEAKGGTSGLDSRLSGALTTHSLIVATLSVVHSLRTRGLHSTLLLAASGNAIPILGELVAVNVLKVLRHHVRPQAGGVPLAIALGWYNVGYGTLAVIESITHATDEGQRNRALAPAVALAATSFDLLLDPFGLDLSLWEWSSDGLYASEVEGPNKKRGVPLLNFAGWIALTTSVTLAYQRLEIGRSTAEATGPRKTGYPGAGRDGALLLLSYYLPAAAWALKQRRLKCLIYSTPFAMALWAALKGSSQGPR
jgi:uncharacterized membrane protein